MTTIKAQVEVEAQNLAYMNSIVRTDLQSLCARSKALLSPLICHAGHSAYDILSRSRIVSKLHVFLVQHNNLVLPLKAKIIMSLVAGSKH